MGGTPTGTRINTAAILSPPDSTGTFDMLRASRELGGGAMDLQRANIAMAAQMPPEQMQYDPSQVSQQAYELGLGNLQRSRAGEALTSPAAAQMREGIAEQIQQATSSDALRDYMDRFARTRGISTIAGSGISPDSTIGRSAIFDATTEAGRKRLLEDIGLRQQFLSANPAPMGGIDPGAAVSAQQGVNAANLAQRNAFRGQNLQNIFGMGQTYADFVNRSMAETMSARQAEEQNLRQYQQQMVNDLLGQVTSENAARASAMQGQQQMIGSLAGAGIGAVGVVAAAMI